MANEIITIECLPDGSYRVTTQEGEGHEEGHQPINETVSSVDEVLELVSQELSDDLPGYEESEGEDESKPASNDADKMWAEEAAKRKPM
ncbi:MAG TPA: hypothetical protein VFM48_16475 [Aquabacterium sp.]|nr:hypothetical protein [Aquabacterium sp.]